MEIVKSKFIFVYIIFIYYLVRNMFNTNQGNTRPNNYIQLSNTLFGKQSTPHNNSIQ